MTTDTQATWQMPDAKYQRRSGGTLARLPLPNVRSKGMRRGTKEERETDEGQNNKYRRRADQFQQKKNSRL